MTLTERLAQRREDLAKTQKEMDAEMGRHQQVIAKLNLLHQAEIEQHQNSVNTLATSLKNVEGRVAELEELTTEQ